MSIRCAFLPHDYRLVKHFWQTEESGHEHIVAHGFQCNHCDARRADLFGSENDMGVILARTWIEQPDLSDGYFEAAKIAQMSQPVVMYSPQIWDEGSSDETAFSHMNEGKLERHLKLVVNR